MICEHCKHLLDHKIKLFNDEPSLLINGGHCFKRNKVDTNETCFVRFIKSNQPERSKREDLNCCNKIERIYQIIEILNNENIDCGEWYKDYSDLIDILNEYIAIIKMRCSEHCGNTVRDK